jgi:PEP-CTERM motif
MNTRFLVCGLLAVSSGAFAQSMTPTYDSFVTLSEPPYTYAGSGIASYGPSALTTFINPAQANPLSTVRLAMSVTPRVIGAYTGPAVTNDGAGTYFVQPGESPDPNSNNGSWNFNLAILGDTRGLNFRLAMDVNPGFGTPSASYLNFTPLLADPVSSAQNTQFSQNLGFYDSPVTYTFNPNTLGQYTFSLRAFQGTTLVDEVAVQVSVVPEPGTYALLLAGLAVIGGVARRRMR